MNRAITSEVLESGINLWLKGMSSMTQVWAKRAVRVVLDRGCASTMVPNVNWRRVPSVAAGKPDY